MLTEVYDVTEVYDRSMSPPVERSLRSLISGVQLKF